MFGRRPRVRCFNATYGSGAYAGRADLGYQVVPVARIVGTVGRCEELDARFRPLRLSRERRHRLETIRRLVNDGVILPPVELYRLKDEYYVVDGNHRVAVAKENGQTYIDAHVIEFLPDGQRAEDHLYLERRAFTVETRLEGIRLSQAGGYARLREEIEAHRASLGAGAADEVTLREAAASWQRRVYGPAVRAITARQLPKRLPGRTAGDLYLDLQTSRRYAQQQEGRELSWSETIARFEAAHPLPTLSERLHSAWTGIVGRIEAWWQGLHTENLPCAHALQAADGSIYCRRAGRIRRGVFEG